MKRCCAVSGVEFEISADDLQLYEELGVPAPQLCPEERNRRRISFRNFFELYHRPCSATGKKVISHYHADQPFPVFDNAYWWSDQWSPLDYGRSYDPARPFFEQYHALSNVAPRFALINMNNENSEYCNAAYNSKNCYLIFGCVNNEDCLYGHIIWECQSCVDNIYLFRCKWCSSSRDLVDCYDVHFSAECISCQESYFLHDCQGCSNCFGCLNLRKKQYCFFNEQLSREKYQQRIGALFPLSGKRVHEIQSSFQTMVAEQAIFPERFAGNCEDVSGDHLYESASVAASFDVKKCERIRYCYTGHALENCSDISFTGTTARFSYNCLTMIAVERVMCSHLVQNSNDVAYSEFCHSSHDLFGCNGMRNAAYCILNKQYSKEEYFSLREIIIERMKQSGEWGEFFPSELSPFAYNESVAKHYMPLSPEEVAARGLRWREERQHPKPSGQPSRASTLPLAELTPSQVFYCAETHRPYKLNAAEIQFYQRMKLPAPDLCPDERRRMLIASRPERKLRSGKCSGCNVAVSSTNLARGGKVLCEACYTKALYE